jgi:membrane fusion protein (multidrug efflux system)
METTTAPKKKNPIFIIILALLVLGGGWYGISKYRHGLHHEETEDAQISADIVPVIPRIAGYVWEVRVKDNQQVKKGDTLLVLDNRDYIIKVQQAEAALTSSQVSLNSAKASTYSGQSGNCNCECVSKHD